LRTETPLKRHARYQNDVTGEHFGAHRQASAALLCKTFHRAIGSDDVDPGTVSVFREAARTVDD
jgi:hypothetical protein